MRMWLLEHLISGFRLWNVFRCSRCLAKILWQAMTNYRCDYSFQWATYHIFHGSNIEPAHAYYRNNAVLHFITSCRHRNVFDGSGFLVTPCRHADMLGVNFLKSAVHTYASGIAFSSGLSRPGVEPVHTHLKQGHPPHHRRLQALEHLWTIQVPGNTIRHKHEGNHVL